MLADETSPGSSHGDKPVELMNERGPHAKRYLRSRQFTRARTALERRKEREQVKAFGIRHIPAPPAPSLLLGHADAVLRDLPGIVQYVLDASQNFYGTADLLRLRMGHLSVVWGLSPHAYAQVLEKSDDLWKGKATDIDNMRNVVPENVSLMLDEKEVKAFKEIFVPRATGVDFGKLTNGCFQYAKRCAQVHAASQNELSVWTLSMEIVEKTLTTGMQDWDPQLSKMYVTFYSEMVQSLGVSPLPFQIWRLLNDRTYRRWIGIKENLLSGWRKGLDDVRDSGTDLNKGTWSLFREAFLDLPDRATEDMILVSLNTGGGSLAFSLGWVLVELTRNPSIFARLAEEVRTAEIDPNDVTYATLSKLKLLDWVCKETLRLYVPYALSPRQNRKEDMVCGYKLPAGTHFEVMQMLPQRSPLYWPNPEKFDPDRWDGLVPERFCYFPWGVGSRACPFANKLSLGMMKAMIVGLLLGSEVVPIPNQPTGGLVMGPLLRTKNDYLVSLKERS